MMNYHQWLVTLLIIIIKYVVRSFDKYIQMGDFMSRLERQITFNFMLTHSKTMGFFTDIL